MSNDADILLFAEHEFRVIHALCDRVGCPKAFGGELLSASQRVTILEATLASLIPRIGMNPVTIVH